MRDGSGNHDQLTMAMIAPCQAPVRPRFLSAECGETLPLDDEVRSLLDAGVDAIALLGERGAGKTTALAHVGAMLRPTEDVVLVDEPQLSAVLPAAGQRVIYTTRTFRAHAPGVTLPLVPWGRDELIEYLLAMHQDRCAAVMARLRPQDDALCAGLPDLWRPVLDLLARDEAIPDARTALRRHVGGYLVDSDLLQRTRSACLSALVTTGGEGPGPLERLVQHGFPPELSRALRHRTVQEMLAADKIVADLHADGPCEYLALRLPRGLVAAVGGAIGRRRDWRRRLRDMLAGPPWRHAMAASILHATGARWVPSRESAPVLRGAYLAGVRWPRVSLAGAQLAAADLATAELGDANLSGAIAHRTTFRQARLDGATLDTMQAAEANFAGADLTMVRAEAADFDSADFRGAVLDDAVLVNASFYGADLRGARFHRADVERADFTEANIVGADFTEADLEGADLSGLCLREATWAGATFGAAGLAGCDLEGLVLYRACFEDAKLRGALLTGSVMRGANFDCADLRCAGLADVDWEGASLRDADLRGASFHMGSTRSGLVGSPIACEGSRTGFYTDDYEEQSYKAPEEIRKANLCRADLRGAWIAEVDFYLVDLRGAVYDAHQEEWLRRSGAILK
jgi:uncharacterized protein YjbI with pentapeptide repeats